MTHVVVRSATMGDIETIMTMYREAQAWLHRDGHDQWSPRGGDQAALLDRVRNSLSHSAARGECFVATINDQVIGTITVDQYADPEFWRAEDSPDTALYLHRMIVSRAARGHGIGRILLGHAERLVVQGGRSLLRLDAWRNNQALHRYYLSEGFTHVRTVDLPHRGSGTLFERSVR
jgi:GNAT superfamily N-acetyltransferase